MINFNDADIQKEFTGGAYPPDSIIAFRMTIRLPKAGKEGAQSQHFCRATSGNEYLDCEFEPAGDHPGRKIYNNFTLTGTNKKGQPNANQSMSTLRAIIESARGVRADDASPQAAAARQLSDWTDFNDMVFLAKVKCVVEQSSKDGRYYVNNEIAKIITPDMPEYQVGEVISDKPLPTVPDTPGQQAPTTGPSGFPAGPKTFAGPNPGPLPGAFGGFVPPATTPAVSQATVQPTTPAQSYAPNGAPIPNFLKPKQ